MSGARSTFLSLKSDWRPICLADGKVIYSEGLGSVRFLSECGYEITLYNVLFIPVSLCTLNKHAKKHRDTYSEITDYPSCKWIDCRMGATEFTATICPNDLAYLDWRPIQAAKSAGISIEEQHVCLNHMPHLAIWQLLQSGSVISVPDCTTDAHSSVFSPMYTARC